MKTFTVLSYMFFTICVAAGTTEKVISKRATIFDALLICTLWPIFWLVYLIPGTVQFWQNIFYTGDNDEKMA